MTPWPEGSPDPLSGTAAERFHIEGPVTTVERAWRLLGDTDWMNRAGGNGQVLSMAIEPQPDGFPLLVGEMAGPLGLRLAFSEVWSSWVNGRFFRQVRDLVSPLVARSDYRAELVPVPGGVKPVVDMELTGPGWGSMLRRGLSLNGMQRRWEATLAHLADPLPRDDEAGRTLGAEAQAALGRWSRAADSALVGRFSELYRAGRPTDLSRMRAFVLADRWGLPRESVLEALLAGVDAGAAELFWSVRCARCYGQVAGGRLLSDVADHADCPACGVRTETDLGANVEVLFAPHPSVVPELDVNFCTIFPAKAPSQYAVLTLAPGQRVQTVVGVPHGEWRLGPGGGVADLEITAGAGPGEAVEWRPGVGGHVAVRAGEVALDVQNGAERRARVYLTQVGGALPAVLATMLTTNDTFRRRLGHQVLASDLRVGVRSVTLLFTDLSGSTAMYEELGDAQAFAVVRDHFVLLREAAAAHGGTVVKTIGDAVMAAFFETPEAIAAALEMQRGFTAWVSTLGLAHPPSLKVGLHVGSALAVHTDAAGLDYFGGTVNLAARAQGAAEAGEVVFTEAVRAQPRAMALLDEAGLVPAPIERTLKGIGEVRLWRVAAAQNDVPA